MANSKYPNKLDTSLEIPAVRDNIIEVGSDVLNSLRSAIFNIERTLGINPQGAVGNTVASRLNSVVDGNGNILKESLDKAGLLSGPIKDTDVSKSAGISESKLKLNFPTSLLQSEISQLIKEIDVITRTLEDLAYLFAAHTHPASKNRHMAKAIAVDEIPFLSSDEGMIASERKTSQEFFESIFSSHINYTGENISATNRSHKANQIFFDKQPVSSYVASDDVQGAIEDTLNQTLGQLEGHQNLQHSNGVLRSSLKLNSSSDGVGPTLVLDQEVLFFKSSSSETSRISNISFVNEPDFPAQGLLKSDIVRITSEDNTYEDFQIHSFEKTADNLKLKNVKVFGFFERNSTSSDRVSIFSNENLSNDAAGFMSAARPYPAEVNLDLIQIANPSAPRVLSSGIRPSEISSSNRYFKILIDEQKEVSIDVYDPSYSMGQDLDSIIFNINKDLCKVGASVLAYRVDFDDERHSEVAIVHSLPASATESVSIKIKSADTDDCLESMGLAEFTDVLIDEGSSSQYYIKGKSYSGLGQKLDTTGLVLISGTSSISSQAVGLDFTDQGISKGDLIIISQTDSDDGTYVIKSVSETTINIDRHQLTGEVWSGVESSDSKFRILKNTVSLEEFEFYKPTGASGSGAIVDLFLDSNQNIFYNNRLEYPIKTFGASGSLLSPCNFYGEISSYTNDDPGVMSVTLNSSNIPEVSLDGGEPRSLESLYNSFINLKSGEYDIDIKVYIENSDNVFSKLDNEGPFNIELYGDSSINNEENLNLVRAVFNSSSSRVVGGKRSVPRLLPLVQRGVTSDKDLSTNALKKVYQTPYMETRSNGVSEGLEVVVPTVWEVDQKYSINIIGGTCYVKGKRFSFDTKYDLVSGILKDDADKVFIAINEWGEVVFGSGISIGGGPACSSPFDPDSFCILSCIEWDKVNPPVAIDLRLLVNDLDKKLLNSITVSPQPGMGHFEKINDAIKYAKRFTDVFPEAGTPTIHLKSGVHKIVLDLDVAIADYVTQDQIEEAYSSGVWINFPVNIEGEGDSTVIDIAKAYSDRDISQDDRATAAGDSYPKHAAHLWIAGPGVNEVVTPDGDNDVVNNGFVTIKNLKMRLTNIIIADPVTEDSDGNKLNWGVNIENVIFDQSERGSFGKNNLGVYLWGSSSTDEGDSVGNINIKNCQFLNSNIRTVHFLPSVHKNISIIDNTFRGNGSDLSGEENYAFYTGRDESILKFSDAPLENNINLRGNILADNNDPALDHHWSAGPGIDPTVWADRVSRNLVVGGRLGVGTGDPQSELDVSGAAAFTGDVRSEGSMQAAGSINALGAIGAAGPLSTSAGFSCGGNASIGGDLRLDGALDVYSPVMFEAGMQGVGSINISDGSIILQNGTLDVMGSNDEEGRINIVSEDIDEDGAGCQLYLIRKKSPLNMGDHLGEIRFAGTNASGSATSNANTGAAIFGRVATDSWDNGEDEGAELLFLTTEAGTDTQRTRMKIMHDGQTIIGGGTDVEANDATDVGVLLIGHSHANSDYTSAASTLHHLALDSNEIQAKRGRAASTLYVNSNGGSVRVGSQDHVGIGLRVDNTDNSNGSINPTIWARNFKTDGINLSSVLTLEFREIDHDDLDNVGDDHSGDTFIRFRGDGVTIGSIGADSHTLVFNTFTGQHICPISNNDVRKFSEVGLIVSSDGKVLMKDSVSETFSGAILSDSSYDKAVYGVIARLPWIPFDEDWGWPKNKYAVTVNSIGNGRVWVTNIAGDVQLGDYVCSSDIPGYGQLQNDDILHSYTVAKVTESIDWSAVEDTIEHDGNRYKKYLASCTYHCG